MHYLSSYAASTHAHQAARDNDRENRAEEHFQCFPRFVATELQFYSWNLGDKSLEFKDGPHPNTQFIGSKRLKMLPCNQSILLLPFVLLLDIFACLLFLEEWSAMLRKLIGS